MELRKLADTRAAVAAGADEIDMVISRGAFLAGDYGRVFDEIVAVKEAAGPAHLKVILETGELGTYDNVRRASWLAMLAGADFIKTSTGFSTAGATFDDVKLMHEHVGPGVKVKAAGGISSFDDAEKFMRLGADRLGTSRLVKIMKNTDSGAGY